MRTWSVSLAIAVVASVGTASADRVAPPPAPAPVAPVSTAPLPGVPTAGTDYGPQVREMFRVAACASDEPVPARFPAKMIAAHCRDMNDQYSAYKRAWADQAQAFIAGLRPPELTTTVVYPFGGGDLTSALTVYPDATELTTISLEAPGDIRVIDAIKPNVLANDLDLTTTNVSRLFHAAHSTTKALQASSHSTLPGNIMFALAGLAVHGFEPVALHYFEIQPDGTLQYLTNDDLEARVAEFAATKRGQTPPKGYTHYWYEQESPFANIEIQFRKRGDTTSPLRTFRHIVANLDDPHMAQDSRVIKHLERKGKVAVMTKAASFLLWYDDFGQIRNYLLGHLAWMISDASGIPPSYADPAGFEQITYGDFTGMYFTIDPKGTRNEFIKMWKAQPHRDLPFRFGYPDNAKHNHLMITRPKAP